MSSCNLGNAMIVQSQLLQPYPQFCNVSEADSPVGFSIYNALQANYNHRFSKGLTALVSYTTPSFWTTSKEIRPGRMLETPAGKQL